MYPENQRLFAIMDSLNELRRKNNFEPLGSVYDAKYWDDEDLEYLASGFRYVRNKLFEFDEFNILSYTKEDIDISCSEGCFTSDLYLSSHDKHTGQLIDRVSFDFYGMYEAIKENRGSLIVYQDSIVGVIDDQKWKYAISAEGKFELLNK
ncbi:hypothetical protein N7E81_07160 [Reichenbachiella carrageenanivorans]|uniref:Uncharacterized protein n=1 Tax=Reichenbachiella carrageenanivorans TaxID=2979869 RepID=A0ABY6D404_9BACT|nr:hypothetical protein [Reichenbachiella carrageenanivorans]UXX80877.1 hypothetical protein N7E81_07160 [Reichenbachiella carrageenanivorans]